MFQQYNTNYGALCLQKQLQQKKGDFTDKISLAQLDNIIKENLSTLTTEQLDALNDIHYPLNKHGLMAIISQYEIGIYFKGETMFQDFFIVKYFNEDKFTYQNPMPEVLSIVKNHEKELFEHIYIPIKILPSWLVEKNKNNTTSNNLSPTLMKKLKISLNFFQKK